MAFHIVLDWTWYCKCIPDYCVAVFGQYTEIAFLVSLFGCIQPICMQICIYLSVCLSVCLCILFDPPMPTNKRTNERMNEQLLPASCVLQRYRRLPHQPRMAPTLLRLSTTKLTRAWNPRVCRRGTWQDSRTRPTCCEPSFPSTNAMPTSLVGIGWYGKPKKQN